MKIHIINGPNLNLLGKREPEIYGNLSFESYFQNLKENHPDLELEYFQSNVEGELINEIHRIGFESDGIVLNAGAYTHTSLAIADALTSIKSPSIEVHISNVYSREEIRHHSQLAKNCIGTIVGFGLLGYELAIQAFLSRNKNLK